MEELAPILRLATIPYAEIRSFKLGHLRLEERRFGRLEVLALNNSRCEENDEIFLVLCFGFLAKRSAKDRNVAEDRDLHVALLAVVCHKTAHDKSVAARNQDACFNAADVENVRLIDEA